MTSHTVRRPGGTRTTSSPAHPAPTAPSPSERGAGARTPRWPLGVLPPVALVVIWQVAKSAGALPYDNVPAPSSIWSAFAGMLTGGQLAHAVGHTVLACLGGWAVGCIVGLAVGLLLGLSRRAYTYGMASVDILRAVPAIAFVPIAVIVLAQTLKMEIVIAAWVAAWPVAVSTIDGVRGVSTIHDDLARSLKLPLVRRITTFALPTAMPKILVSLKLSLSAALVLAIVAEIVGNPDGIGYALVQQQQSLRPDAMFAYILVTGLLGLVLNHALTWILNLAVPGARSTAHGGQHDA